MTELLPCPFCGSKAKILEYEYGGLDHRIEYQPSCTNDNCGVDMNWLETEEEAVELWNKRIKDKE